MTEIDFNPHTEYYTIVYNSDGEEIDRLKGRQFISGKDYIYHLPIEYRHIRITTEVLNVVTVENNKKSN